MVDQRNNQSWLASGVIAMNSLPDGWKYRVAMKALLLAAGTVSVGTRIVMGEAVLLPAGQLALFHQKWILGRWQPWRHILFQTKAGT